MRDWARISAVFSEHRGKPKNAKISFSKEQAKAFNELRVAIAAAPVLQLPDFNKPFYLETDASKYAIGSCLLQEVDGKLLPIAFRSVIMSGAQVNWCITEKEMYALVDATAHWRRYLLDRPFVVRTDHKPNTFFQTQPKLTDKLLRWVDHLAMYDPEYVYVPGEDLIYADLLSRPPIESYEAQERPDWRHCECRLCRMKKYDDGQDRFERGPSAVPTKQLFKHTCAARDGEPVTGHVTALVDEEREGACHPSRESSRQRKRRHHGLCVCRASLGSHGLGRRHTRSDQKRSRGRPTLCSHHRGTRKRERPASQCRPRRKKRSRTRRRKPGQQKAVERSHGRGQQPLQRGTPHLPHVVPAVAVRPGAHERVHSRWAQEMAPVVVPPARCAHGLLRAVCRPLCALPAGRLQQAAAHQLLQRQPSGRWRTFTTRNASRASSARTKTCSGCRSRISGTKGPSSTT